MYVGVNRLDTGNETPLWCIPHVCGGEPRSYMPENTGADVFPMYVGVNR